MALLQTKFHCHSLVIFVTELISSDVMNEFQSCFKIVDIAQPPLNGVSE